VADLRADIGSRLQQTKFETSWNAYRTNLVDALVDEFTTEIPESILTGEMEEVLHRFSHSLSEQDIEMDNYLDISGQSQEEFVDDIRKTGTRNVQTELLLDAIADDAGLTVTDEELDDILNNIGEPDGKAADEIRETLSVGQKKKLNSDILRQKAHEHMIKAAVPLDEDGNIIDYDAVFAQLQEQRQAHMDELQAKASETENTTSEDSGEEE
jgi:trigger factor